MQALSLRSTHGWAMTYVMVSGSSCNGSRVTPLVCRVGADLPTWVHGPNENGIPAMTSVHPLDRLRVGMRAVVRHRLDDGLSDALGEVVALDDSSVSVATRRGVRVVPRGAVVAAKEVPPAPSRRGAPHLAPSMGDLQRVMVEGWPPTERAALGGWMLRAAGGFTGRANSVLPLGDPGLPLPEAVLAAERWYAERQLTAAVQPLRARGLRGRRRRARHPADRSGLHRRQPVGGDDGLRPGPAVGRRTTSPPAVGAAEVTVHAEATPSPGWWAASDERRRRHRGTAEAIMAGSPDQVFLSLAAGRAGRGDGAASRSPAPGPASSACTSPPARGGSGWPPP